MSAALTGLRIVVTRSEDQAEALAAPLRRLGATVLLAPAIRSEPPYDPGALAAAARSLAGARWLGFTSPSGVRYGWPAVAAAWPEGLPHGLGVAALGPGTAEALGAQGVTPSFRPDEPGGDAFAAELPLARGDRVVLMRSDIARRAIADVLRQRGADVLDAVAYHTVTRAEPEAVHAALDPPPEAVTFTSPSTVRGFIAGLDDAARLAGVALVPIGPVTAAALTEAGLPVATVPEASTLPGLLDALVAHFT